MAQQPCGIPTLFLTFLKIGAFTFGGGYAMIPLIQREVTEKRSWLAGSDILDIVAIAESTPGPFAINIATFVGNHMGGLPGGILATLGVVLPSFLIILLIAKWFGKISDKPLVQAALDALRPAVVALIAAAVLTVAESALLLDGGPLSWNGWTCGRWASSGCCFFSIVFSPRCTPLC